MDEIVTEKDAPLNIDSHEAHGNLWRGSSRCDVIPSSEECMAILTERLSVSKEVVAHSKKVAQVALHLTNALNKEGCDLNAHLVVAASLLHDLAKGSRNHASVAERFLREMNFNTVASVVGAHMSVEVLEEDQSISEREVVCLADNLVQGDNVVGVTERYRKKLDEWSYDIGACEAIAGRLARSLSLQRKLEARLGASVESLLRTLDERNHAQEILYLPT